MQSSNSSIYIQDPRWSAKLLGGEMANQKKNNKKNNLTKRYSVKAALDPEEWTNIADCFI